MGDDGMSKENKFKFWLKNVKAMMSQEDMYQCCIEGDYDFLEVLTGQDSSVTPLQYTGLKDKNDVEIYKGDIIPYGGKNYEVIMLDTCWTLKDYVGIEYYGNDLPELQDWSEFEVIGNVHQNPELLK